MLSVVVLSDIVLPLTETSVIVLSVVGLSVIVGSVIVLCVVVSGVMAANRSAESYYLSSFCQSICLKFLNRKCPVIGMATSGSVF
jgi:hypothetical protein